MSKAAKNRKRRRHDYLRRLAEENPAKFRYEWAKRLRSWNREAQIQARRSTDGRYSEIDYVAYALRDLAECGNTALDLEADNTKAVMRIRSVLDQKMGA